jgi:hypothetical protein
LNGESASFFAECCGTSRRFAEMHQWVEFRSGFGRSPRKVVILANRSGFLYVLDAKDASSLRPTPSARSTGRAASAARS